MCTSVWRPQGAFVAQSITRWALIRLNHNMFSGPCPRRKRARRQGPPNPLCGAEQLHCQHNCLGCRHPRWSRMEDPRHLYPKGSIQAKIWPWLIRHINVLGSDCLAAAIRDHLGFRHPRQLCRWCLWAMDVGFNSRRDSGMTYECGWKVGPLFLYMRTKMNVPQSERLCQTPSSSFSAPPNRENQGRWLGFGWQNKGWYMYASVHIK